jgi:TatD DNase family protein
MGKSNRARRNAPAPEAHLLLPPHPALAPALAALPAGYAPPLVDTHTHLAGLHDFYTRAYPAGAHAGQSAFDLVRALYAQHGVQAVVDVWCEAPVLPEWRAFADGALEGRWGGLQYWFVMGAWARSDGQLAR